MTATDAFASAIAEALRVVVRQELAALAPPTPARAPELLTVAEAAARLKTSTKTVYRRIAEGRLRATKMAEGGSARVLIQGSELDRLLDEGLR